MGKPSTGRNGISEGKMKKIREMSGRGEGWYARTISGIGENEIGTKANSLRERERESFLAPRRIIFGRKKEGKFPVRKKMHAVLIKFSPPDYFTKKNSIFCHN